MTARIGSLEILLGLETAAFRADMNKATKLLNSNVAHMKRSLSTLEKSFNGIKAAAGLMVGAFVAIQAGQGVAAVVKMADEYKMLQARIQNATSATGDFASVSKQLSSAARQLGTDLETQVSVFQRIQIGAKELGKSNEDILKLSTTIQQIGTIGGSSAEAMKAGMIQFAQSMAGGIMRAEEFNSIVENMPEVAKRMASGMGMSIGQLRQKMLDGDLTAKEVFDSLIKQSADVQKEFDKMPVTVERAMNTMNQSIFELVGALDQATGGTGSMAGMIQRLSSFLDRNRAEIVGTTKFILQMGETTVQMGQVVFGALASAASATVALITFVLKQMLQNIQVSINGTTAMINNLISYANRVPGIGIKSLNAMQVPGLKEISALNSGASKSMVNFAKMSMGGVSDLFSGKSVFKQKSFDSLNTAIKTTGSNLNGLANTATGGSTGGKGGALGKVKQGIDKAKQAMEEWKRIGENITESNKTIWEKYAEDIAKAEAALSKHVITTETFNREKERLNKNLQDSIKVEGVDDAIKKLTQPHEDFLSSLGSISDAAYTDDFNAALEVRKSLRTATQQLADEQARLNGLVAQGFLTDTESAAALEQFKKGLDGASQSSNAFSQAFGNIMSQFGDKFIDSILAGKLAFRDMASSMLADIAKLILKTTSLMLLQKALGGMSQKTGWVGNVGNFLLSSLGWKSSSGGSTAGATTAVAGARAGGGSVSGGSSYLVGEKGPELFTPSSSGFVHKAGSFGGGSSVMVNNTVNVSVDGSKSGDSKQNQDLANKISKAVMNDLDAKMDSRIMYQLRNGGLLNRGLSRAY